MYTVKRTRTVSCQAGGTLQNKKEKSVQCDHHTNMPSYNKQDKSGPITYYDQLVENYLCNTKHIINWLKEMGMIASQMECLLCGNEMEMTASNDRSDGCKWQCRKTINGKRHKVEQSIRKRSWFDNSNMTLVEILKFTYWWSIGID